MKYIHPRRFWRNMNASLTNHIFPLIRNHCAVLFSTFFHVDKKWCYIYSEAGGGILYCAIRESPTSQFK